MDKMVEIFLFACRFCTSVFPQASARNTLFLLVFPISGGAERKPYVEQSQEHIIGDQDGRCHPLPPVEFPLDDGPEDGRWKECGGMGRDIHKHVEPPGCKLPERPS